MRNILHQDHIIIFNSNYFCCLFRYKNYLKLEQLKIYGILLSEFRGHQLLSDDSILNPLLLILNSYDGDCLSVEIEKHLVTVLRQFCVVLSHNPSILSNVLKENTKNSK